MVNIQAFKAILQQLGVLNGNTIKIPAGKQLLIGVPGQEELFGDANNKTLLISDQGFVIITTPQQDGSARSQIGFAVEGITFVSLFTP